MKMLKSILAIVISFFAVAASAQTADEIINKYITAMGGAEKLASLQTVKMEGSMSTQGVEVVLIITKKQLTGLRMDMDIMGTSNYQLATPVKGWIFMPVMQQTEPQEMDADQLAGVQNQMDIQGSLFNYKQKGYTVEYVATEKIDGKDAYKLKLVRGGKNLIYFIDATSGFVLKIQSKANVQGQEMDVESSFTDYKKNAEGFWFPYTSTTRQGVITFDKISANVPVDDKIFTN
ncbi:MAG: outer membrane lipoprotein-sorting protein [Gloeobacteraceae cyanobacterium ES-bin-316]|nr:outer membrane lipoprotein-sorting protein [Ferruginibacter sp.]